MTAMAAARCRDCRKPTSKIGVPNIIREGPGSVERGRPHIIRVPAHGIASGVAHPTVDAFDCRICRAAGRLVRLDQFNRVRPGLACRERTVGGHPFFEEGSHVRRQVLDDGKVRERPDLNCPVADDVGYVRPAGPAWAAVYRHGARYRTRRRGMRSDTTAWRPSAAVPRSRHRAPSGSPAMARCMSCSGHHSRHAIWKPSARNFCQTFSIPRRPHPAARRLRRKSQINRKPAYRPARSSRRPGNSAAACAALDGPPLHIHGQVVSSSPAGAGPQHEAATSAHALFIPAATATPRRARRTNPRACSARSACRPRR